MYARGGFLVYLCPMDREFEPVEDLIPLVEGSTIAIRGHIFTFKNIPGMVLIHTIYTMMFWLKAIPNMPEE